MEDINRLKIVLVEKKRTVNGWLNNWGKIRQLYLKRPASKLKLSFDDGTIIMEHDSVSTFKVFVENVGIARVASLNMRERKDTPLISNNLVKNTANFSTQ